MHTQKFRVILFDADGVVITPADPFSVQYAQKNNLDPKVLATFFDEQFSQALIGKKDLKELLEERRELWKWQGSIDDLLHLWFTAEDHKNEELLAIIEHARTNGIFCAMAMNQEKYRTQYVKEVMFPNMFDMIFSSAEIGFKKPSKEYYMHVLKVLREQGTISEPGEVVYFDDSARNVEVARELEIRSFLYSGSSQVEDLLKA